MKWSNEARIGLVVLLAVVIFIGGTLFLRGVDLRSKQYSLRVYYQNVNGLNTGDLVTVAGLAIGRVESMALVGSRIEVDLSIQTKVHLPRDSRATIKSETIMGGKFVEISPGSSLHMLADDDTLAGAYEADLSELTATLAPISSNVLGILENINSTFDEPTRNRIQRIVADLGRSSARLEQVIRTEGSRADDAFRDFAVFSRDLARVARTLDTIAQTQRGNIDTGMISLRRTASKLDRVSDALQDATESLSVVLGKMRRGEGSLGKLLQDDRLYENLDSLSINLNALVKDIRENPERYVRVSVF
jgi:phospholipid/cholesterol/gamma-HCH transport system substrate-binding protein